MSTITNKKPLANPGFQKYPTNQREWSHYQNEVHKVQVGSFTPTFSGFSDTPTASDVTWRIQGGLAIIRVPNVSGTSDAATFLITNWPQDLHALFPISIPMGGFIDNGSAGTEIGYARIPEHATAGSGTGLMAFGYGADNPGGGGFTTSAAKGIIGGITTLMYPIDSG